MKVNTTKIIQPVNLDRVDPKLVQAARAMEANFLKQLVRAMRSSVPESADSKNNRSLQLFRGMLDDTYAEKASESGRGIGLAELIVRHLTDPAQTGIRNIHTQKKE